MGILTFLPLIFRIIEIAPKVAQALNKKQSVFALIQELAPDLLPIFKDVGAQLFPNLGASDQVDAGALRVFDPVRVRWIQESLNKISQAGLVVDGDYGEKTKAAVTAFQRANGLEADGWCGHLTSAAIEKKLSSVN